MVSQADLAALWQLADAVLRWRAAAAALATAAAGEAAPVLAGQTAILVEAGVKCNLQHVTQVGRANPSASALNSPLTCCIPCCSSLASFHLCVVIGAAFSRPVAQSVLALRTIAL